MRIEIHRRPTAGLRLQADPARPGSTTADSLDNPAATAAVQNLLIS